MQLKANIEETNEKIKALKNKKKNLETELDVLRKNVGKVSLVSEDEFEKKLNEDGTNLEYVKEAFRQRLIINKFLNQSVLSRVNVSNFDVDEIYKNTTPHAIPEFGELSMILIGLSFVGIVALTKRHDIISVMKKLKTRLHSGF